MTTPIHPVQLGVKMVSVDAKLFESVGYVAHTRQLYIKFHDQRTVCFHDIPGFRYAGLMSAPRMDAYFGAFIKDRFLTKELPPPAS